MKTVKVIFVDNIDSVLIDQLNSLHTILDYLSDKDTDYNWPSELSFDLIDENNMTILYSDKYTISIVNYLRTINPKQNPNYDVIANEIVDNFTDQITNKYLYVVDLCLGPRNGDPETGKNLVSALNSRNNNNINVIACTGEPDYVRYSFDNVFFIHRALSNDSFYNEFPAFTYSPIIDKLDEISEEKLRDFLRLFLENPFKNTQYFGELLFEAIRIIQ